MQIKLLRFICQALGINNFVLSNIAENNFITDCVALFWCHRTADRRAILGVVLRGHGQKTRKTTLNLRWKYLIYKIY